MFSWSCLSSYGWLKCFCMWEEHQKPGGPRTAPSVVIYYEQAFPFWVGFSIHNPRTLCNSLKALR